MKKYLKSIAIGVLLIIFTCVMGYTGSVLQTVKVALNTDFYFLVSTSTHIQASTHLVAWSGGSGYLLSENGQEYVAFSVYFKETDAVSVQASLNEQTQLIDRSVDSLYLKKQQDKKNAQRIKGAFNTLYSWLQILEHEICRLSQGATQQSSKQTLNILKRQMEYVAKADENYFLAYTTVCKMGAEELTKITEEIIYIKDLRYLLCQLCEAYCELADCFSV